MTLIKVFTEIFIDTNDPEAACGVIDSGLEDVMNRVPFPAGEIVEVDVDHYEQVAAEEAEEKGLVE